MRVLRQKAKWIYFSCLLLYNKPSPNLGLKITLILCFLTLLWQARQGSSFTWTRLDTCQVLAKRGNRWDTHVAYGWKVLEGRVPWPLGLRVAFLTIWSLLPLRQPGFPHCVVTASWEHDSRSSRPPGLGGALHHSCHIPSVKASCTVPQSPRPQ